jgi:hypothetical protein
VQRVTPVLRTLRDTDPIPFLPPGGRDDPSFRIMIVGPENRDAYCDQNDAIRALGEHFGLTLSRDRCYLYANLRPSSW